MIKKNLFWLLVITLVTISSCKKDTSPPNIIFIMADDHTRQAISAYGSVLDQTPNIDRLATEGMLFENATVTNSICAPSRAVILTGQFSHVNGKIDNTAQNIFDSTNVTFPRLLQGAGYQTAMIGKWHLRSEPVGFDYWKVLPGQGAYYNPDFISPGGRERIEGYVTDIITDLAIDWLNNIDRNRPFLLMYHHKAPHREWEPKTEYIKEYIQRTFPEPPTLFDDYSGRGTAAHEAEMRISRHMNTSGDNKILPDVLKELGIKPVSGWDFRSLNSRFSRYTKEQMDEWNSVYLPVNEKFREEFPGMDSTEIIRFKYQRYMQDYLACCASVDENIGRLLDWLEENDLDKNTIVVYTSDQGFYLGEHGWFDKRFMYNESFSIPLLVRWPGVVKAGSRDKNLVQNLDFAETFLDAAGVRIPDEMQGRSLLPLLRGKDADWRDAVYYHYYEYPAVHMVKRHYGVMTDRYKLIHFYNDIDEWEMYDLRSDPSEMNNIYNDPDYRNAKDEMENRLRELRILYKDTTGVSF